MDLQDNEKKILMDHNYDGIQELDNNLPPWWKNLFYATIIFAFVYYLGHEYFGWFMQQEEEYSAKNKKIAEYQKYLDDLEKEKEIQAAKRLASSNEPVPTGPSKQDIEDGKKIYVQNCIACHGADGGGTVGPNLTDNFWIHGDGTLPTIIHTVAKGVPEKGMLAWESSLGKSKVKKVSIYVLSLKGTKPAAPKAAQGNEFK